MLQIDESQLQVYSCNFLLQLQKAFIPLNVSEDQYFIEWKIKSNKHGSKTKPKSLQQSGVISFQENLKLHTQILRNMQTQKYLKRFSQLTIFLVSNKQPQRPKIVGSMLIGLHEVLNSRKYFKMQKHRMSLSPIDVDLQFSCQSIKAGSSSILEANLGAALVPDENFLTRNGVFSGILHKKVSLSQKKEMTLEYLEENDTINNGDCSMIQPQLQQSSEGTKHSNKELPLNSISVISNAQFKNNGDLESIIKIEENEKIEALLLQNKNLKKLLMVTKTEKKIQLDRLEGQIRQLAYQLSVKEAEVLKITQQNASGNTKVGELLDQNFATFQNIQTIKKENESLHEQIRLERKSSTQAHQNYKRLQHRFQMVVGWQQERKILLDRIKQLEEDNQLLKAKCFELQNQKNKIEEVQSKQLKELNARIKELQIELHKRDKVIHIYEEKVSKFEQQISILQQAEIINKTEYYSSSQIYEEMTQNVTTSFQETTSNRSSKLKRLQEEGLKRIKEEQLQQSFNNSIRETSVDLQENRQAEFYRSMARNVQQQLDHLTGLYRQKDTLIYKERTISNRLKEELQRLRFQFVYELSKVTSILNQKIMENRQLNEQNFKLKNSKKNQTHIWALQKQINNLREHKVQLFNRCYDLEQENRALLNINRQKQQIYQSMLRSRTTEGPQEHDMVVQQFQRLLAIMLHNSSLYSEILQKYGLLEQSELNLSKGQNQPNGSNISAIMKRFSSNQIYCLSDTESNHSDRQEQKQELLIQSNANKRKQQKTIKINNNQDRWQSLLEEISQNNKEKTGIMALLQTLTKRSQARQSSMNERVGPVLMSLKKEITKSCSKDCLVQLLKEVNHLQSTLQSYDFY